MDSTKLEEDPIIYGLLQLPADSEVVTDADEEIFLLYTDLQRNAGSVPSGLGHVDARKDTLSLTFELLPPPTAVSSPGVKRSKAKSKRTAEVRERVVEVELVQDKTALQTRKGDTGSVLWRVTIEFARVLLQQNHIRISTALLEPTKLANARVLELGAGTGLLSILLAPLVSRYTATDLPELLPLIRKNIALNLPPSPAPNITVSALDWHALLAAPQFFPRPAEPTDLILAVDCIYHPALVPPFLAALTHFAVPGRTAVLVAVELRAADVLQAFVEQWVGASGWEVRRVGGALWDMPWVVWAGWRLE
ncbi:hypothetical protein PLICRDRAFT_42917 [Plicaturopsis crispa FD-325 SS-3]|nr:hypothetical protein PLICRDRAFT_42917 [Plicaturopsis crispa FD-325 SS-3]